MILIFIAVYTILFIILNGINYLITNFWKKFTQQPHLTTEETFRRDLTELEQEAFHAYHALMKESMKAAEEDYHERREELKKNESNERKKVKTCE